MSNEIKAKNKAFDEAFENERRYGGCCQCVLGAIRTTLGHITDDVFKSGTGFAGGIARSGMACGACTGGVMALSMFVGREYDHFDDPQGVRFETYRICEKLINCFVSEYGSINCWDIQKKIMGRSYDLSCEEEYEIFLQDGGHDDKCPYVCGNAAKWVVEIIEGEGLLP